MRILLVNYRYFVSGGPERYMFGVADLLEGADHEVIPLSVRYSMNEPTPWSEYFVSPIAGETEVRFKEHGRSLRATIRAASRSMYSREVYHAVRRIVEVSGADVAYVLHYLRKMSPSVLVALRDAGIPAVVRLSDFAMICPGAHLLRDGSICEECTTGRLLPSVINRCVQGSLGASVINAASTLAHRGREVFDLVDTFACPTAIMRDKMQESGLFNSRFELLPTFVGCPSPAHSLQEHLPGLVSYVGRFEPEKGVETLMDAMNLLATEELPFRLKLAGIGHPEYAYSLERRLTPEARGMVQFAGQLDREGVMALLVSSQLSVVPSLCYENLPNSLLESWSAGTPVLASDIGSLRESVGGSGAGQLFEAGNAEALASGIKTMLSDPDAMASMSRTAIELTRTVYSPERHLERLEGILSGAVARGIARS